MNAKDRTARELLICLAIVALAVAIVAAGALSRRNTESTVTSPSPQGVESNEVEQMQSETQTVETVLLSTYQAEVLPTDDIPASDVLPTDDLPTDDQTSTVSVEASSSITVETPAGSTELPYEEEISEETDTGNTQTEITTPKTYNGITEGDTFVGTLSYYDVCYTCCGSLSGVTASGQVIYNGMENPHVCSCNWLPLGTQVSINGVTYTVADRGGYSLSTIGRIDIFVPEGHQTAVNLGITYGAEIVILAFPDGV